MVLLYLLIAFFLHNQPKKHFGPAKKQYNSKLAIGASTQDRQCLPIKNDRNPVEPYVELFKKTKTSSIFTCN